DGRRFRAARVVPAPAQSSASVAAHRSAWEQAEQATQRLGVLVEHTSIKAIVRAVGSKLGISPEPPPFDRDAKGSRAGEARLVRRCDVLCPTWRFEHGHSGNERSNS